MSARIANLPRDLPPSNDGEDDEAEETDGLGALNSLPSTSSPVSSPLPRRRSSNKVDLSPLSASTLFAQAVQVALTDADLDIRVYITPPIPSDDDAGSIMVFHHGAGYSALSFACLAKVIIDSTSGECGVMAFDARAHGMDQGIRSYSTRT